MIIVEGIHGLNPKLTEYLPQESLFKIFISALTAISIDDHNIINPSDNRLIRRMVRDHKYRGYSALDTLKRWESVLSGEQKHIVPYQEEADVMFNSALAYELGKSRPLRFFENFWVEVHSNIKYEGMSQHALPLVHQFTLRTNKIQEVLRLHPSYRILAHLPNIYLYSTIFQSSTVPVSEEKLTPIR